VSPSFYSTNQFMLGLVNLRMGNKEAAKNWFTTVLNFKVIKEVDKEVMKNFIRYSINLYTVFIANFLYKKGISL